VSWQGEIQVAQTVPADGGAGGTFGFFLPILAMFLLLYALVIRPQSRQQKEHRKMISEVQRGDHIVTSGGIHGRVTGVSDEILTVEIADRVRIRMNRSAVASRSASASRQAAPEDEKKEKKEKRS
jgi:preprotein translocase subunit YajC